MNKRPKGYLFNLDVLIEADNNAKALEQLLHILNQSGASDYRIKSGSELGRLIDSYSTAGSTPISIDNSKAKASAAVKKQENDVNKRIFAYIKENRLIRVSVNKARGVKMSIPCRIINFDETKEILTLYHVDEKQVYTFTLNEIDDFIE